MSFNIEDGTGKGYRVQVDSENKLMTRAVSQDTISHISEEHEDAYGINTPLLTVTTTGGRMLYIKNTSSTKSFYFNDFWFNWNGGSTNFNRPCYGQLYFGDGAPSACDSAGVGIVPAFSKKPAHQNLEMMGVHLRAGPLAPAVEIGGCKHKLWPQTVDLSMCPMDVHAHKFERHRIGVAVHREHLVEEWCQDLRR